MRIQSLSHDEVFASLFSGPGGIKQEEATRRMGEYGPNEIREMHARSLASRLADQFTHFLALLLWFAAALCFLSEYLHPGEGLVRLGIAILAVIFINAFFTFIQEYRTEKAIEELRKLLPYRVAVVREGVKTEIDVREIVPGDLILLREGDKVPADGRVIQSSHLTVNNAPLTGESDSRVLTDAPCEEEMHRHGTLRHERGPRGGGHRAAGRQLRLDRARHRRGAHRLRKHPQLHYLHICFERIPLESRRSDFGRGGRCMICGDGFSEPSARAGIMSVPRSTARICMMGQRQGNAE